MRNKTVCLLCVLFIIAISVFGCGTQNEVMNTPLPTQEANSPSVNGTDAPSATSVPTVQTTQAKEETSEPTVNSPTATPYVKKTATPTEAAKEELVCSLKIDCSNILNNLDDFDENKLMLLGDNGIIYSNPEIEFEKGETVFDVVVRVLKENKIHFEYTFSALQNSYYIEGINNIYELDCGGMSGWMYAVNGIYPNCSLGDYVLQNGDSIAINYTCDMGADLGRVYS